MSRAVIKPQRRKICVADLRHRVKLLPRAMREPGFEEVNFGLSFSGGFEAWAKIVTVVGSVLFDGVSTDVAITHEVYIRHNDDVTAETLACDAGLIDPEREDHEADRSIGPGKRRSVYAATGIAAENAGAAADCRCTTSSRGARAAARS